VIRSGGNKRVFDQVYAPATLGQFLREFTFGHCLQLASVARAHLINLAQRTDLLLGIEAQAFVDIDSLRRPVFGHAKQGASFGHAKVAGRVLLRRGLSPLATTISTSNAAPVIAGIRLRSGKTGSGKGAASMVREAIATARAAGAVGEIPVRGDSAYGNGAVVDACLKAGVRFSVVLPKNPAVLRAIGEQAWTPVPYPGAEVDPETGELISDARLPRSASPRSVPPSVRSPSGHRSAGGAWGPGPEQARGVVPGLALSPVLHQQRRTDTHSSRPTPLRPSTAATPRIQAKVDAVAAEAVEFLERGELACDAFDEVGQPSGLVVGVGDREDVDLDRHRGSRGKL
jgi:hypothetical protein